MSSLVVIFGVACLPSLLPVNGILVFPGGDFVAPPLLPHGRRRSGLSSKQGDVKALPRARTAERASTPLRMAAGGEGWVAGEGGGAARGLDGLPGP